MNTQGLRTQCLQLIIPIVFVPKRRKPVLVKEVAQRLQEIIFELVKEHGWKLIALEIMPDLECPLQKGGTLKPLY